MLSTFTLLNSQSIDVYSSCSPRTLDLLNNSPFHPQPIVLSASMNLITLSTSSKWDHTVLVFLWLAYFTWYNVLEVHLSCGRCLNFLPSLRLHHSIACIYRICLSIHLSIRVAVSWPQQWLQGVHLIISYQTMHLFNVIFCKCVWVYSKMG